MQVSTSEFPQAGGDGDGTAYILIGFEEDTPNPAQVVRLQAAGAIDDSRLQQFVNEKLNNKLEFRYEEGLYDGRHVAVITIPKQQRPFYSERDYGKVRKHAVYVRRGSSTAVAAPGEVAKMGDAVREKANVALEFMTEANKPLPHNFERKFVNFPADLPDMANERTMFSSPVIHDNHDYFREFATFFEMDRLILSRFVLANRSGFSLTDLHVEVSIGCPPEESVDLYRADDVPDEPSESATFAYLANIHDADRKMTVDDQGAAPLVHIGLGTVRPSQTARAEEDLAIVPSAPGVYSIRAQIFANELPVPILVEHQFDVSGEVVDVGEEEFLEKVRNY